MTIALYVNNMNLMIMFSIASLETNGENHFLAYSTKK
jgi:hypothetical protein